MLDNYLYRAFNFPIQLLEGFLTHKIIVLHSIFEYAIFVKAISFKSDDWVQNTIEALKYYGFKIPENPMRLFITGKSMYESIPLGSPKVGINLSIWRDYYENDKSEFDNVCLLAFLAFKSILGRKPYCKVVNNYWLARMDGKPRSINDFDELSPRVKKYLNEYQARKIKKALENSWGLKTYSYHTRGFYISFKMNLVDLICVAEQLKKSYEDSDYKAQKKKAREKALEILSSKLNIQFVLAKEIPGERSDPSINSLRKYRMKFRR